jgi:hypothetical protein
MTQTSQPQHHQQHRASTPRNKQRPATTTTPTIVAIRPPPHRAQQTTRWAPSSECASAFSCSCCSISPSHIQPISTTVPIIRITGPPCTRCRRRRITHLRWITGRIDRQWAKEQDSLRSPFGQYKRLVFLGRGNILLN